MKLPPWFGTTLQALRDEIRTALERANADPLVSITLTSGTEQAVKYGGARPVGFVPVAAYDSTGAVLAIASWSFNPSPASGPGFYGVTVTFVSGSTGTVTGRLIGG